MITMVKTHLAQHVSTICGYHEEPDEKPDKKFALENAGV
jgi:hypothetical protein